MGIKNERRRHKLRILNVSLLGAASCGNEFEIRRILKGRKVHVDARDKNGKTPLMLAVEGSHEAAISAIFEFHPSIYVKNHSGESALQMVLKLGLSNKRIVEMFLNALKKEYFEDSRKLASKLVRIRCPLYLVALLKDAEIMRMILEEKNCGVDDIDPCTLQTAMHVSCSVRDCATVKLLIEYNGNVNAMDSDKKIPFAHYKFFDDSEGELDMLKLMIDRCTNFTKVDRFGYLQLHCVLKCGKRQAVHMFLKSNIDWCAINKFGKTPLDTLITLNEMLIYNQDILEELRDKKIDANAVDRNGNTILSRACLHGITSLVDILLNHGADPNMQNKDETLPLYIASKLRGNPTSESEAKKIIVLLLQRGADPQGISVYHKTIFDSIVEFGRFDLAEIALGHLAINESLGIPVKDFVRYTINSRWLLKQQFSLCKAQLEKFKITKIRNSVSLFTLLTASEKTLVVYARKEVFVEEWRNFKVCCPKSYCAQILQTQLQKTMRFARLRKDTAMLVCVVMKIHYGSFPAIVDKITDYVNFENIVH